MSDNRAEIPVGNQDSPQEADLKTRLKTEVDELSDMNNNELDNSNDIIMDVNRFCTEALFEELSKQPKVVSDMLEKINAWLAANESKSDIVDTINSVKQLKSFLESIVNHKQFSYNVDNNGNDEIVDSLKETVGELNRRIGELLKKNYTDATNIKSTLNSIKIVLDHPKPDNVKKLQKYIYDAVYANLSDAEKQKFEEKQKGTADDGNNSEWSGVINQELLKGVGIVLNRIENSATQESTDVTTTVGGVEYHRVDAAAQTVIMEGAVLFEPSIETSTGEGQDISTKLPNYVTKTLGNLDARNGEKIRLLEAVGQRYFVKLDDKNCLYPIAVRVDSDNEYEKVFLKNNTSCIQYLKNKIPDKVKDYSPNVNIGWNGKDYVIGIPGTKCLTVEPMTIDGKWLGGASLEESLAMLCFVNYLRNSSGIGEFEFANDNPDLEWDKKGKLLVKIKKNKDAKADSGEKDKALVDLGNFGLNFLITEKNEGIRSKFIKYNNGEHWKDNWDKKEENQGYDKVDIQKEIQDEQRRKEDEQNHKNGVQSSTAQPKGNSGSKVVTSTVVEHAQITDLKQISIQNFNYSGLGIEGTTGTAGNPQVYESGPETGEKVYYYQQVGDIIRLAPPYIVKEKAVGKSFVGGQLPENTQFFPENDLNFCEQGKKSLEDNLKKVYDGINPGNKFSGKVNIDNDKSCYEIVWGENGVNKIKLDSKLIGDNKIFGYDVDKPEDWLKVVCYAIDNYGSIKDNGGTVAVNKNNEYGITGHNKDKVAGWLKGALGLEEESNKLVVLPDSIDGIGSFVDNSFQFEKDLVDKNGVLTISNVKYQDVGNAVDLTGLGYRKGVEIDNSVIYFELGFYNNGKLNGNGVRTYRGGSTFNGSWLNGQMQKGIFKIGVDNYEVEGSTQGNDYYMKIVGPEGNLNKDRFIDINNGRIIPVESSVPTNN